MMRLTTFVLSVLLVAGCATAPPGPEAGTAPRDGDKKTAAVDETKKADTAKSFVKWATSKAYVQRVGETEGWVAAPPGTRKSTYANPQYQKAAPFAATVLAAIESADPTKQTKDPVPYTGIQFVDAGFTLERIAEPEADERDFPYMLALRFRR